MRLFLTGATDPYYNLAAEEYYLRFAEDDVFMLWQNAPTVVIGKNQNYFAEVDHKYAAANGITIARRITGGGAVYHDLGNVNFSFLTSRKAAKIQDFSYFTAPISRALRALGLPVELSGRNDLVLRLPGEEVPLKFSGNADTATKTRILSHGTILFDSDLSVLGRVLTPDREKLKKHAVSSVKSRVTNLRPHLKKDMDTAEFLEFLKDFLAAEYGTAWETADRDAVLATGFAERNRSAAYLEGEKTAYPHRARLEFPGGLLALSWDEADGLISRARLEGDFMETGDVRALEAHLVGLKPRRSALSAALRATDIRNAIRGLTKKKFLELFPEGR